jgi:TonB-linked SusC/RagA family outer membrane protein
MKIKSLELKFVLLVFLFTAVSAQSIFAQQRFNLVGTVVDKAGESIIGANIKLKEEQKGTITDLNGKFSLQVFKNAQIVVSYIGMEPQTLKVVDNKPLYVVLEASAQSLDEVVVIGYGQSTKRDLTGSMSKVNIDDITKAPVPSVTDALGGRIAGVSVTSPDGQPGAVANIVIRGSNSLTGDNSPLYVIDGFPLENAQLNATPPEDIESIEILKDASATAIYGARGSNGVIIITTKKGKVGKPTVSYDGSFGMQKVTKLVDVMSPYEFVRMYNEVEPTLAQSRYFINGLTLDSYKDIAGTNYQNEIFREAPMHSHNLAVRGGTEATKYSVSLNYMDQKGVMVNGGFKRMQGKFVLDQEITKKIKAGINVGYVQSDTYGSTPSEFGFKAETYIMTDVWGYRPVGTGGEDISEGATDPEDLPTDLRFNPVLNIKNIYNDKLNNNLSANAYIDINFNKYLKLRSTLGTNISVYKNSEFYNSNTKRGNPRLSNPEGVNGQVVYNENNTWLNENIMTYNRKLNKNHKIIVMGGFTAQGANSSSYGSRAINLPYESLGLSGMDHGKPQLITAKTSEWTLASFLGRVNYDYKSRFLLTASMRADGSSKFPTENKWSYFPSGSVAWRIGEENFVKNHLKSISDLKLRLSSGATGNNRVGDFAAFEQMTGTYYYNGNTYDAIVPTSLANKYLKWESTRQDNIGLDLGLFAQRLTVTVDLYNKVTNNLLLNSQIAPSTGYRFAMKNIGKVANRGVELTINSVNIKTKNFQWTTNFNISFNKNIVLELSEGQHSYSSSPNGTSGTSFSPNMYIAIVGQPMAQMLGYVWDGVYQYSDFDKTPSGTYVLRNDVTCNSPSRTNVVQPGYVKFRDLNGDKIINTSDLTTIGNPFPIHIGGFNNTITYKGFELSAFLQWSYGNDIYNGNRDIFESGRLTYKNMNHFATFANRWSPDNQTGVFPVARGDYEGNYASTRSVEDGSFLRLKMASMGYYFDKKIVKSIGLSKLKLYVSGTNLFTLTNYDGYDPEVSAIKNALIPGFDYSTYPRARTFTVGINAEF